MSNTFDFLKSFLTPEEFEERRKKWGIALAMKTEWKYGEPVKGHPDCICQKPENTIHPDCQCAWPEVYGNTP